MYLNYVGCVIRLLIFVEVSFFCHGAHASSCRALFSPTPPLSIESQTKKLASGGFALGSEDSLVDVKSGQTIGRLSVVEADFLYEWASADEHSEWTRQGGITKADMDFILESPGQMFGRGYYVSSHPLDSAMYGTALTIFKPTKPLLLAEIAVDKDKRAFGNQDYSVFDKEDVVKRMRIAGIDGIHARGTWFAIINEKQLQIPSGDFDNAFMPFLKDASSTDKAFLTYKINQTDLWEKIPATHPLRADFEDPFINASRKLNRTKDFPSMEAEVRRYIDLAKATDGFESAADALLPVANPTILTTLKYFDMFTLDTLRTKRLKDVPNAEYAAKASQKIEEKRALTNLNLINNFNDFQIEIAKFLSQAPEIRDYAVVMSGEKLRSKNAVKIPSKILHQNPFLSVTELRDSARTGLHEVEYLSLSTVTRLGLQKFLSKNLRDQINAYASRFGKGRIIADRELTPEEKTLLKDSLQEFTALLFKTDTKALSGLVSASMGEKPEWFAAQTPDIKVMSLYITFISIHPYTDGNGRASRMYYEWASKRILGRSSTLQLAKFDADAFLPPNYLHYLASVSSVLNNWIAGARNQEDYVNRLVISKKLVRWYFSPWIELFD